MTEFRYSLTVHQRFSAAHFLRNYQGKCEAMHGHNFQVSLTVSGHRLDPRTEILIDFGDLKAALKDILASLDHACLNEIPPFDVQNPSSENIARHVFLQMESRLPDHVQVEQVRVAENENQSAACQRQRG